MNLSDRSGCGKWRGTDISVAACEKPPNDVNPAKRGEWPTDLDVRLRWNPSPTPFAERWRSHRTVDWFRCRTISRPVSNLGEVLGLFFVKVVSSLQNKKQYALSGQVWNCMSKMTPVLEGVACLLGAAHVSLVIFSLLKMQQNDWFTKLFQMNLQNKQAIRISQKSCLFLFIRSDWSLHGTCKQRRVECDSPNKIL